MIRHGERGSSLAWAMLVLAAVATSVAISGSALARRTRLARLATEAAALDDLRASAAAVGRLRARHASWRGPDSLELEGGTATMRLHCDARGSWLDVEVRVRSSGRTETALTSLPGHAGCAEPS